MKIISITLSVLAFIARSSAFSASAAFEVDIEEAFASSTFPIQPNALIARAKQVLSPKINLGIDDDGACLADDFVFAAAVVGPIGKDEYLAALKSFKLQDSFDIQQNLFGFTVSPVQPNRVYFFSHQTATLKTTFAGVKAEDVKDDLILPPQCHHIDFDTNEKITEFGFYTVDRRYGNTGGLGGAFGYFYGVGKPLPIPECQPFKPSFRFRFLNFVGRMATKLKGGK